MIVDRIEGSLAVVEMENRTVDLPSAWLPSGAGEGSVLRLEVERHAQTSRVTLTLDAAATADRMEAMHRLRDSIEEGPSGDITL
jgi:hypothetical protein